MPRGRRQAEMWHRLVLFDNPVLVTHETHTRVMWEWVGFIRAASTSRKNRVSGNLHYSTVRKRPRTT